MRGGGAEVMREEGEVYQENGGREAFHQEREEEEDDLFDVNDNLPYTYYYAVL